jgi:predicted transcriptional regulator
LLVSKYTTVMARKKMTTYMDEDLLRSAKILAAHSDSKMYEIFEEALRRYLKDVDTRQASLAEALSEQETRRQPGVPREKAVRLPDGETLSEAIIADRQSRH